VAVLWHQIEKEQLKKDLNGMSPDELDSGALTFAQPDMAADLGGRVNRKNAEYARTPKPYDMFADLEGNLQSSYGDDVKEAGKF
jgi:hypothetical protein